MAIKKELAALCDAAVSFHARGYAFGSTGNLSVRDGDTVWITPTGQSLRHTTVDSLAAIDLAGKPLNENKASKEYPFHLAAYAAAAISKGDPIRTGIQGFSYDIRTAVLPFMFIFNTDILLIDVSFIDGVVIFVTSTIAMLAFCSATQQFIFVKNRAWETIALLLIAFTMFRPDFWLNQVSPQYLKIDGAEVEALLNGDMANAPSDLTTLRIRVSGPDFDDANKIMEKNTILTLPSQGTALDRLSTAGLLIQPNGETVQVEEPFPGTPLFQELSDFDFYADRSVQLDAAFIEIKNRPAQEWFYIPAFMLLGIVLWQQRRRHDSLKA